jgi:enoyl-CoA hydratase
MPEENVIYEKKPPIAFVTMNRPEKLNTLNRGPGSIIERMAEVWVDVRNDPEMRVAVLKGAGRCFCAGLDISGQAVEGLTGIGQSRSAPSKLDPQGLTKGHESDPWVLFTGKDNPEAGHGVGLPAYLQNMWDCPKPIIAQVHSYCLGFGLALANFSDIVVASPNSLFGYPPIRFGDPMVMSILMPWLLGMRKVSEMAYTGAMINADDAHNCGLINRVVSKDKLDDHVLKLAKVVAAVPPMVNLYSKLSIHHYYEMQGIKNALEFSRAMVFLIEGGEIPYGTKWFQKRREEELGLKGALEERMAPYAEYDFAIRERAKKLADEWKE